MSQSATTASSPPPEKATTTNVTYTNNNSNNNSTPGLFPTTPNLNDNDNQLPLHSTDLKRSLTRKEQVVRALKIRPTGESGRSGIHPLLFLRNVFRSASWASRIVNVLWPVVPAAIAVRYALPDHSLLIFILSYLAMVPCANLIGFAGQELGRKVPHVMGVLIETT